MSDPVHQYTFEVDGISCAGCVSRAETAMQTIDGIINPTVNLGTRRAQFSATADQADQAFNALTAAGYPAKTYEHRFVVDGMTCASCIGTVEQGLRTVPEVRSARANLANGVVTIRSVATRNAAAIEVIKGMGYSVTDVVGTTAFDPEGADTTFTRFVIAAALTLPLFVLEMGGHLFTTFHHWIARTIGTTNSWTLQFVLASLVLIWPGAEFYRKGVSTLIRLRPDMNSLVVLGASAAWLYSTVALFAPSLLPAADRTVYFEAAGVIVTLILLGRWMEARAKWRANAALSSLIGLRPDTATLITGDTQRTVTIDTLAAGDHILVAAGARIPVDGAVVQGSSWVDESMITGEPIAVEKQTGDPVTGGTINGNGALVMQASAVGDDTVLARVIDMVEAAQATRLPVQNLVNRITLWFVPAVIVIAVLTTLAWLALGPDPVLSNALVAGVSVLIIACPCAMGLAVPVSIMVGSGRAAELGVLFRQGDALQKLAAVRSIAFDKTGTLTIGKPTVTDTFAIGVHPDQLISIAAAVERQSDHPLAAAICNAANGADLPVATDVTTLVGRGLQARVDGQEVLIGNDRLMVERNVDTSGVSDQAAQFAQAANTIVYVAKGGQMLGLIALSDPVHPSAGDMIGGLKNSGVTPALITGDTQQTAQVVAQALGIENVHAQTLPADKADIVAQLGANTPTAFVGDGINDAPALAQATVGIAMGGGTDVALETADVTLMRNDPAAVLTALRVSKATMRNIWQNLGWAFGYNILLIPVAALGLLSPGLAAGAMALSSVLVVGNALRLKWIEE